VQASHRLEHVDSGRPTPRETAAIAAKPSVDDLGVDVEVLEWRRSGTAKGAGIEVALAGTWVFLRLAGGPGGRVSVFNRHEWKCFLDGAKRGEFDDAALPH
jgi:hypothetical protein